MSSLINPGFRKIQETITDSKVLDGLAENGVLPRSLRFIKASIDFTGQLGPEDGLQILDVETGTQVHLDPGEQILYFSAVASTTLTSGGSPTFDLGLSPTQDSAVATVLGTAATTMAALNAGVNEIITDASAVTLVGATNQWLSVDVNVVALTAGVLQVVLIVV